LAETLARKGQRMRGGNDMKPCTTHHHACDCRERALREALIPVAKEMREVGLAGDDRVFQWYADLNEMWLGLYGRELTEEPEN
jgi:hypothetical protein